VYSTRDSKRVENWNETEDWKAGTPVRLQSLEPSDSKVDTSPGYRISIQKTEAPLDSQETSSSDETDTNKQRIANAVPQNDELTFSLFPNALPTTAKPSSPSSTKTKSAPSNRDPLNWYGIPPLRQAQASFISAVESSVPQLLNTSASMHDLEARITKLKIELRLRPGPDADQSRTEMGKGRREQDKAAGAQDIREPEAVRILISSLRSIFQVFVDLGAVDAASVSSRTLLSGLAKETFPGSPHKVGLSREIVPEERGPKGETKREIEDRKSFTTKSGASSKQDEKQN